MLYSARGYVSIAGLKAAISRLPRSLTPGPLFPLAQLLAQTRAGSLRPVASKQRMLAEKQPFQKIRPQRNKYNISVASVGFPADKRVSLLLPDRTVAIHTDIKFLR